MVSNLGMVKSLPRLIVNSRRTYLSKEHLLKPYLTGNRNKQYFTVRLSKDGVDKQYSVHRLVAMAFIPNPDNLPQVNHINEDRNDNRVENLEWCTNEYNVHYGSHYTNVSKTMTNGKTSKKVNQLTLDGELVRVWPSVSEITRSIGYTNISACCCGKRKSAYGFIWEYSH